MSPAPAPAHVAVSAHRDGFRRAGRQWSVQPTVVAVEPADAPDRTQDAITPEELEQLRRDPNVAVVPTAPDADGAPADPVAESRAPASDAALAAARAAHLRTATALAPDDAERTGDGRLTVDWLACATGLDGVTAAERDAAAAPDAD